MKGGEGEGVQEEATKINKEKEGKKYIYIMMVLVPYCGRVPGYSIMYPYGYRVHCTRRKSIIYCIQLQYTGVEIINLNLIILIIPGYFNLFMTPKV